MSRSFARLAAVSTSAIVLGILGAGTARAQDDGGERHIIIKGSDGTTREIHIRGGDGSVDPNGNQVVVFAVNGGEGAFSFIGSPGELPFGGMLGPMGMVAMSKGGINGPYAIIDPGISYVHQLIKRPDVRSDLFLDSKQKEQLDAMDAAEAEAGKQRVQEFRRSIGSGDQNGADAGQSAIADKVKSLREMAQGMSDDRDKKLAAILTPKQIKRLKELDLQFRGPLAMGVKPVADRAKVVEPQAPVVADLLKQYREGVRKALGVEQTVSRTTGADGSARVNVNSNFTASSPDEMRQRMMKAHDEIEESRRKLGDKALKSITGPQRDEWKSMTGVKFQFVHLN